MTPKIKKHLLILLGLVFVGLGTVGIFLPLLPTTPFMIVAAVCFARSHKGLHDWLLRQPHIGLAVRDWQTYGVIRKKPKILATALIVLGFVVAIYFFGPQKYLFVTYLSVMPPVLYFIWSRPSQPTL